MVYDSNTGEALIGVSVLEVGTTNGTITDFDGKYTLKVSSNKVSFSYVGFKTEIVNVTNSGTYNVNLVSDNELDEVVVIGYGTQRKSDLTGALASISILRTMQYLMHPNYLQVRQPAYLLPPVPASRDRMQ